MLQQFPIRGEELTRLIPQKSPFVFITSLESVSDNKANTTFTFDENHALCFNRCLSSSGLLEHIAQSAGCRSGYESYHSGKHGNRAFIGEIKNFSYKRLPQVGEELNTEITLEATVYGVVNIVSGKTFINSEEIASCTLKIFFEPEPET